jgi:AraC family transcriptional regulator
VKAPSWPFLISLTLILLAATVGSVAWKLGALREVEIVTQVDGPFHILSKDHLGPYHKIADVILEVEAWARSQGEPCTRSFGEFFDNPERTDEDRLRSRGGCILNKSTPADLEALNAKLPAGYAVTSIDERLYAIATFDGAPSLGPVKVYPKVLEYVSLNRLEIKGAVIEIYEVHSERSGSTRYLFPVVPIAIK